MAAIVSALAVAGGITLTILSGGVAAVAVSPTIFAVIKLATGTALTAAGAAGLQTSVQGGLKGTFIWKTWGQDVGFALATSLIVFPAAFGASYAAGNLAARNVLFSGALCKSSEAARVYIHKSIVAAATLVYGPGQGMADAVRQLVQKGKIDPVALVISLAVGAWSGFNLGKQVSQLRLDQLIAESIDK